jgi:hypothetical protein
LILPHYYVIIISMDNRFIEVDGKRLRKLRRVSDLEQGKRGARTSTLRKLAEALGVEPRELMKEE